MLAFDGEKYISLQTEKIKERLSKFPNGKLYFEIGGKFLNDEHASRVLPGFDPQSKIKTLQNFHAEFGIIFCISSPDVQAGRVWKVGEDYSQSLWKGLQAIADAGLPKPVIAVNLYDHEPATDILITELNTKGFDTFLRYKILNYPHDVDEIVGPNGFGKDEYMSLPEHLIVVTGLGSDCGKMSTCLGQIYLDKFRGIDSGYAKYETFPIWNLPLEHPVNLAYEAATADIGDYNVIDTFYHSDSGEQAVNYNRDVDAFPVLAKIIARIVAPDNFMHAYLSPTDMGINMTKAGIIDDKAIIAAATAEIRNRLDIYQEMVAAGTGKPEWVERCAELLQKAENYPII